MKDPEPLVRLKAIEYLCDLEENDEECLAALLELVKRRDTAVREKSARMIARYGSAAKPAVSALIEILRTDTNSSAISAAAQALGQIGPDAKAALPALAAIEKQTQKQLEERNEALKNVPAKSRGSELWDYEARLRSVRSAISKIDQ